MAEIQETIELIHNVWWFCQRGKYDHNSVLEGQDFRQLCKAYDTLEVAKAEHPEAEVRDYDERPRVFLPKEPPAWFDPLDAGEVWSESDY